MNKFLVLFLIGILAVSCSNGNGPKNSNKETKTKSETSWFFDRFGYGTAYESATFSLESFSLSEYRSLIAAIKENHEVFAMHVLGKTLLPYLQKTPEDKLYENLKEEIYDKEFLKIILSNDPSLIRYIPAELSFYKQIAYWLVENNPYALEYLTDEMKDDDEIVSAAIQKDASAINLASERLIKKHKSPEAGNP